MEQSEKNSLENQILAVTRWAEHHDVEIIESFKEIESGYRGKLKELGKALNRVEELKPDYFLVFKLDRMGRRVVGIINSVSKLDENTNLVAIVDGFDSSTPVGKMMRGLLALFAEYESESNSIRTRAGMERTKKKIGRPSKHLDKEEVLGLLKKGVSKADIARLHDVSPTTLYKRIENWEKETDEKIIKHDRAPSRKRAVSAILQK